MGAIQSSINNMLGTAGTVSALSQHLSEQKSANINQAIANKQAAIAENQAAQEEFDKMKEAMEFTDKEINKDIPEEMEKNAEEKEQFEKRSEGLNSSLKDKKVRDSQGKFAQDPTKEWNAFNEADKSLNEQLNSLRETRIRQAKQMELISRRMNVAQDMMARADRQYAKYVKKGKGEEVNYNG